MVLLHDSNPTIPESHFAFNSFEDEFKPLCLRKCRILPPLQDCSQKSFLGTQA